MRCHFHTHTDGKKYWIPGCYGGLYGKDGCYCYTPVLSNKINLTNRDFESECNHWKSVAKEKDKEIERLKKLLNIK